MDNYFPSGSCSSSVAEAGESLPCRNLAALPLYKGSHLNLMDL